MDPLLLIAQVLLLALSIAGIAVSDTRPGTDYMQPHLINVALALVLTIVVSRAKPEWAVKLARPLFVVAMLSLIYVLFAGVGPDGKQRWVSIPGIPFTYQPSELAKLAVVLYLAAFFHNKPRDYPIIGPVIATTLMAALVVVRDFDTGLLILVLAGFMMAVIGVPWRRLLAITTSAGIMVLAFSNLIVQRFWGGGDGYESSRFGGWLSYIRGDGDAVYQLAQSIKVIAQAGLFGHGVGQPLAFRLPSSHNDMIFSTVIWAGGWLAGFMMLFALWLLLARGLQIAANTSGSKGVMAVGLVGMLTVQAAINIGGAVGFLPISGSPLPLVSYGGNAMMVAGVALGLLHALSRESLAQAAAEPAQGRQERPKAVKR